MTRFDIALGHYMFCCLHYSGQWDPLYAKLCRISQYLTVGAAFSESKFLDEDNEEYSMAREVYYALCAKNGVKA